MTEILVYQLSKTAKRKAMPKLLETIISKGNKVFIYCDTKSKQSEIDDMLWSYEQLSFLPHATQDDLYPEKHPILIGTDLKYCTANVLFLEKLAVNDNLSNFEKVCIMLDQNENMNELSKLLSGDSLPITYFYQTDSGWNKR